ncbi:MAG: hypothetical protein GY868_21075, partial [Deltaproteobacteria bacterium]|nr:hypothetical protein [Deltaproteobacteria bacterium]
PDTVRHAGGSIKAATAFGSYLLTAESNGGVRLFDLGDPGRPAETAVTRDLFGDPVKITYSVDQQLAYGSAQIAGLQIYAVTTPAAVPQSFEGRWVGSGDDAVTAVGVTIEIDQAQADISGSVTLAGRRIARGSLTAAVDNSTLSGTITFADSGSAAIQLAYDSLTDTLSGTISGSSTVESITLDRAGIRSQLPLYDILAIMQKYLADRITSSPYPLELLMLNKAAVAFGKALNSTTLSDMLLNASVAEAFITLGSPGGVVAAADSWLQPSGRWEIDNARSIADGMLKDICLDYREEISGLAKKGNQLYSLGVKLALKGNPALAMYAYAGAAGCFEQIFALYQDNQPLCPEYDLADFNGYYEGIIDFGFSMGAVGMCVTQADNGSISGQAIIEIAATGEKMGGNILEASNESVNDASIINGYIQIFVGSTEAHVLMIDWQHNPSIDQWEGGVDVDLQHVDATSTVKFVAAECPDEWLIEAAEIID